MVQKTVAVEDHLLNVLGQGLFGNGFADRFGRFDVAAMLELRAEILGQGRGSRQSLATGILDDLGINMPGAAEHTEAGTDCGALDLPPHPNLTFLAGLPPYSCNIHGIHLYPCLLLGPGLAGFAQDSLVGVLDPFPLVGFGFAKRPDLGGGGADQLLVDPGQGDTVGLLVVIN